MLHSLPSLNFVHRLKLCDKLVVFCCFNAMLVLRTGKKKRTESPTYSSGLSFATAGTGEMQGKCVGGFAERKSFSAAASTRGLVVVLPFVNVGLFV
jgi:hypothetical protein